MPRDFREDGLIVPVLDDSSFGFEKAVRMFKKAFEMSHVKAELKKREFYLSPMQKRRAKDRTAKRRAAKEAKRKAKYQTREIYHGRKEARSGSGGGRKEGTRATG